MTHPSTSWMDYEVGTPFTSIDPSGPLSGWRPITWEEARRITKTTKPVYVAGPNECAIRINARGEIIESSSVDSSSWYKGPGWSVVTYDFLSGLGL